MVWGARGSRCWAGGDHNIALPRRDREKDVGPAGPVDATSCDMLGGMMTMSGMMMVIDVINLSFFLLGCLVLSFSASFNTCLVLLLRTCEIFFFFFFRVAAKWAKAMIFIGHGKIVFDYNSP